MQMSRLQINPLQFSASTALLPALAAAVLLHIGALAALAVWRSQEPQRRVLPMQVVSLPKPVSAAETAPPSPRMDNAAPVEPMTKNRVQPAPLAPPAPVAATPSASPQPSVQPATSPSPAILTAPASAESTAAASTANRASNSGDAAPASTASATAAPHLAASSAKITEPVIVESSYQANKVLFELSKISRSLGEHGTVTLELLVGKDGRVKSATVKKSSGFTRVDEAALRGARLQVFRPATQDGQPIERLYTLPVIYPEPSS
jgi:periplasmic protein TonB